jgi:succinate-semialdehyde dehydrogenase / glutarate-semialdehyde dehydrogenase
VVTGATLGTRRHLFEPTVLTDVTTDMVITKEETFGPVASLYRFKTDDEGSRWPTIIPTLTLPRARGGKGGLAAYFRRRDIGATLQPGQHGYI